MLSVGLQLVEPGTRDVFKLYHLARLSESMLRRWLLARAFLAGALDELARAQKSSQTLPNARIHEQITDHGSLCLSDLCTPAAAGLDGGIRAPSRRLPLLHLAEPERGCGYSAMARSAGLDPRLTWLDEDRVPIPEGPLTVAASLSRLKRRCAALQAVLDHPERHVQRMTKWLIRAAKTCRRIFPLRVGDPPGASHRQRRKDPERQTILSALNTLCWDLQYPTRPP